MARKKLVDLGAIQVTRKKSGFTQVYNEPIQKDLEGLAEIGLLTYLLSLPEDWKIHKTHLQQKFTRRSFDNAWKKLIEKQYALEVSFFADGYKGKIYLYAVSDEKFTQNSLDTFVKNADEQLKEQGIIMNAESFTVGGNLAVPEFICIVQNVQYKLNSTKRTTTNKDKQKKINKDKELIKIVNKETKNNSSEITQTEKTEKQPKEDIEQIRNDFTERCDSFYQEFAPTRWTKQQWHNLISAFVANIMENERYKEIPYQNRTKYCYAAIKRMTDNHDIKNESAETKQERLKSILEGLLSER